MKHYISLLICLMSVIDSFSVPNEVVVKSVISYLNNKYGDCERIVSVGPQTNEVSLLSGEVLNVSENDYVFFVDLEPKANWCHKCELMTVGEDGVITKSIDCDIIPNNWSEWNYDALLSNWIFFDSNGKDWDGAPSLKDKLVKGNLYSKTIPTRHNNFAIIISGGQSKEVNHSHYWNDCSTMYQTLTQVYGYKKENIFVLFGDGTNPAEDMNLWDLVISEQNNWSYGKNEENTPLDLDYDGENEIKYSATKKNVTEIFNIVANKIKRSDDLFLFVTDHGNENKGICLWGSEYLSTNDLSKELEKINANQINMLFLQCYGGAFVDALHGENRVIMSASKPNETTWSVCSNFSSEWFKPWFHHFGLKWIAAMSGYDVKNDEFVNADLDGDGIVSFFEAFDYAKNNFIFDQNYVSTPIFWASSNELWNKTGLIPYSESSKCFSPTNRTFYYKTNENEIEISDDVKSIDIVDINGVILKSFHNEYRISLSDLKPGNYIVVFTLYDNYRYSELLMINK